MGLSLAIAVVVFALIASLLATARIDIIEGMLVAGGGFYKVKVPLIEFMWLMHASFYPMILSPELEEKRIRLARTEFGMVLFERP
ncbi:hypothetical protein [Xanthomonas oryzae]|uniref:hypothetical protein n=1 Tax=Xanthomonas oryzae TaxID=347 RepID=UPI002223E072|nr:hypothetical protein [Xanthomonas oryzae]